MGRLALTAWLVLVLILILLFSVSVHMPPEPSPAASEPAAAALRVLHRGEVLTLGPEEYLLGVLAAEMPADFEPEALKAQAVAARTYALCCAASGKHADAGADVCTDFHCCQAWKGESDMRAAWGEAYDEKRGRICAAVEATAGQVLRFEGAPAFTAFHSSSAGFTEDCGAIWSSLPYLVSVSSPESAESVPNYVSHVSCMSPVRRIGCGMPCSPFARRQISSARRRAGSGSFTGTGAAGSRRPCSAGCPSPV